MANNGEFDDLMPHRISVAAMTGTNEYGRKTYASPAATYSCLFDDTKELTRNDQGEFLTVSRVAYINSLGNPLTEDDKFVFPDGTSRPVVRIQTHYDEDGTIHSVTVYFS